MREILLHDGTQIPKLTSDKLPAHIGVIMDGNGRWAKEKRKIRTEGHKAGEAVMIDFIAGAIELGIKSISFYAFSTENWARPKTEVRFLMNFSRKIIHSRVNLLNSWDAKILWSGRREKLWKSVYNELQAAIQKTKNNEGINVNFCINYGGQAEIIDAVNKMLKNGKRTFSENDISKHLYNAKIRPADLIIRTSGEQRISNFLLWDAAYSELEYIDKLWPDCTRADLFKCVKNYTLRDRRFGSAK